MGREDAAARVRRRLVEWVQREGHGSIARVAEAIKGKYGKGLTPSALTGIAGGKPDDEEFTALKLKYLDAVAELLNMPPGELVAREGDHYVEVTPTELRLLRYFRSLPDVIRGHAVAYLDFLFSAHEQRAQDQIEAVRRNVAASRLARSRIDRHPSRRKRA